MKRIASLAVLLPCIAYAGGSNYGIVPGTPVTVAGTVSEWPDPPRDSLATLPSRRTAASTSRS